MTRKEIAKKLGLSVPQVRRAEESGLRKLREALEKRGFDAQTVLAAFKEKPGAPLPRVSEKPWREEEADEPEEETPEE